MRIACSIGALLGVLLSNSLLAQQPTPAELSQWRQARLQKPVFQQNGWGTDFDRARAASKQSGKPIFAYFTRSYAACAPCEALEDTVLASPQFAGFSAKVVLFLHCASHVAGEPLPTLAVDKGYTSYPTILYLDANGDVLTRQDEKTVVAFEQTLQRVGELQALQARAAKGDAEAVKGLFLLQLQLDAVPLATMQQRAQQVTGLSAEQRTFVDQKITDAMLEDLQQRARAIGQQELGKRLAELAKAGHRPSPEMTNLFWNPVLGHARDTKDAALAQQAYDALVAQYGKDHRYDRAMTAWRQQVAEAGGK